MRLGAEEDRDGHQLGNNTAYDLAIHRVMLVGVVWEYSIITERTSEDTASVAASLSCLRVNQYEPGSKGLSSAASSTARPMRIIILVGVTALAVLYL